MFGLILTVVVFLILYFVIQSAVLYGVTKKWYSFQSATYTKSLIILLIYVIVPTIITLLVSWIVTKITSGETIVALVSVTGFISSIVTFHILLKKRYRSTIFESVGAYFIITVSGVILTILIAIPLRLLSPKPFIMSGQGMEPTYQNGDYLIVKKSSQTYERGDVIVFRYPHGPERFMVQRVIALPGDTIAFQENSVVINGDIIQESYLGSMTHTYKKTPPIVMEQDKYFVMGDNREKSGDSRLWGHLDKQFIVGKVAGKSESFSRILKANQ